MKYELPRAFLMPDRCACCLAPADAYLASSLTRTIFLVVISIRRTARIQIPYCAPCRDHVERSAGWRIFLKAVLVLVAGFLPSTMLFTFADWLESYPSLELIRDTLGAIALFLPPALMLAYVVRELLRRGGSPGPEHIRSGPAIVLTDFADETLTLDVYNPKFLALLEAAQAPPRVSKDAIPAAAAPASRVAPPPPAPSVPPKPASESVRRRLASLPRDAKPERVLRFVTFQCRIESDGIVAVLPDRTERKLAWTDVTQIYTRRLPHEPPWERMLIMDLVPGSGAPIRIATTTSVNFRDLPGGAASLHLENCRRLAAYVEEQNPDVSMDPATRAFVSGFGPCPALSGIEQFFRYDDRYAEALEGFRAAGV